MDRVVADAWGFEMVAMEMVAMEIIALEAWSVTVLQSFRLVRDLMAM